MHSPLPLRPRSQALYTDEGSAYWQISNNIVHNSPECEWSAGEGEGHVPHAPHPYGSPSLLLPHFTRRAAHLDREHPRRGRRVQLERPECVSTSRVRSSALQSKRLTRSPAAATATHHTRLLLSTAYQDVHGTNITMRNNTFIPLGTAFPPEAQAIMNAAGVSWLAGPKPM